MNIPSDVPTAAGGTTAQPAPSPVPTPAPVPPQMKSDDHWPICRCSHPMHPQKVELRRGVKLERFTCPRRRWWNQWKHPNVWQPPRN